MNYFTINVSQPFTIILLICVTVLLLVLGKEIKNPLPPAIGLFIFLGLTILHAIQLNFIPEANYTEIRNMLFSCIGIDSIMIFVTFFGYLWIDDIACKFYKKKSIDNSLDWFWKKV